MIISPPFLPAAGLTTTDRAATDPMMDVLDRFTASHGGYPIAFDRRWHTGLHLVPDDQHLPVRAIADGEVVAFRVCQKPLTDGFDDGNSNAGFVLLRHTTETGENRTLTFYSLYMHLLDLDAMNRLGVVHPADDQGKQPPHALAPWLQHPTGEAVPGSGKKVSRKDILGYLGKLQNMHQLHFEVFMTQRDFKSYFDGTQFGHTALATPTGTDYWGHSYYVIPTGQAFFGLPPGTDEHNKLNGIKFDYAQSGKNERRLQVEVYFHKGDKYTNVWSVADNGARTLLTESPVVEKDYEYDLYNRATKLYPACPSDGYELLRFGRILSTPATLAAMPESSRPLGAGQAGPVLAKPRVTWFLVTFAEGKKGYIDISDDAIQKLSDADFPFFMGWQKISESASDSPFRSSAPFDSDGLWDLEKLTQLVGTAVGEATPMFAHKYAGRQPAAGKKAEAQQKNDALKRYVNDPDSSAVRDLLQRFVCEAPSEWDSTHLDTRYKNLLDAGEHFEGKQAGYEKFLAFVKKIQFWGATGLPAGEKLWFFHPLAFIRHFRRCGWLSNIEIARTLPLFPFYSSQGFPRLAQTQGAANTMRLQEVLQQQKPYVAALNRSMRMFGIDTPIRKTNFLAQINWETAQWRNLPPNRRIMHEWFFGKYSENNPNTQYYAAFYGRGIMQLTWAGAYLDYRKFRGSVMLPDHSGAYDDYLSPQNQRITLTSKHWTAKPGDRGEQIVWAPRFDPNIIGNDPMHACDSGGYFWVSKHHSGHFNINRIADEGISSQTVGEISRLVNGGGNGYFERQAYAAFISAQLTDTTDSGKEQTLQTPRGSIRVNFLLME
jgi:hypothetical protein